MDGFGFSEAFGHAKDIQNWASTTQKQALDLLFSTSTGAGMTILRNRIGSGGSGDSILPNSPGSPGGTPQYVWDRDDRGQVWFSKQAIAYGVNTIYADAWSAPGFMKTNGQEINGGWLCGVTGHSCGSGDWKQAYANMLVQYVKYYQQEGINVTHLGFLNEPDYVTSYSSMQSDGTMAASFIKVLAPTLANAGLSNVKIACCDAIGWSSTVNTYMPQLKAAGVESTIGVVTSHAYSGNPNSPLNTTRPIWQTEAADLNHPLNPNNWYSNGGPGEGMTWALQIYDSIVKAGASGYLYWEGAEPGNTNAALVLLEPGQSTPTASKRLWAFGQWSRFVRPGAVRLGTSGSGSGLQFSAFKNPDGSFSVQVLNSGGSAQSVTVAGVSVVSAKGWVSAQGTDLGSASVTVSGGQATGNVPAHSMFTFVLNGA
ncbi:hypothetical protein PQX77_017745 [Marasmius sp. AFHP31]|nr:hypothetical protein PQX77_017745 [Marasmius sp. AFHP31]